MNSKVFIDRVRDFTKLLRILSYNHNFVNHSKPVMCFIVVDTR